MKKEELYKSRQKFTDTYICRTDEEIEKMAEEILGRLSLQEKLGQLYQMVEGENPFGSKLVDRKMEDSIKNGDVGTVLGVVDWEKAYTFQKIAVAELIHHGAAKNDEEAARLALEAGLDIEMVSDCIVTQGEKLVKDGTITQERIDESVKRVLKTKIKLGLFENPYGYIQPEVYDKKCLSKEHREVARDLARKSMVLLKNENKVLPIQENVKSIALVGPFADSKYIEGAWAFVQDRESMVSLKEGLLQYGKKGDVTIHEALTCDILETNEEKIEKMIESSIEEAKKADLILLAIGEAKEMSGEAKTYSSIGLLEYQKRLTKRLVEVKKPIVMILFNGRPVLLDWYKEHVDAIVEAWFPGTEGGNAIADVLFGAYNPSGKLAMSFPYNEGQIPVFYRHLKTGRPFEENPEDVYRSKYEDIPNHPLYPFGYGLSYTSFAYSDVKISSEKKEVGKDVVASVTVENIGDCFGHEVVQLYIRDVHSYGIARPVKELKGIKKIGLEPKEKKEVQFVIDDTMLESFSIDMKKELEDGVFEIYIGDSSTTTNFHEMNLKK